MLTATLDGLVTRFGLSGQRVGEVVAGAVLKHSRDYNLTRECVLGSRLDPSTPAYDVQRACGTGLEAVILVANKIALGQIDAGIAGGVDSASDAPLAVNEGMRSALLSVEPGADPARPAARGGAVAPDAAVPAGDPAQRRTAYRTVHGGARGADRARMGDRPGGAGRARAGLAPAAGRRVPARFLRRPGDSLPGPVPRPEPAPGHFPGEARGAAAGLRRHDDRGQLLAAVRRRRARPAGDRGVGGRAAAAGTRLPRRRAPVRGDRRPDHGNAGQAARRAGYRPRPDLDLHGRRPGGDRDPGTLSAWRPAVAAPGDGGARRWRRPAMAAPRDWPTMVRV